MAWVLVIGTALVLWIFSTLISLFRNYQAARRIGLPIRISPISPLNPLWFRFQGSIVPWLKCLPGGLGEFTASSYVGWPYADKYALHQKLGGAFVQVNPGVNEVVVADAKTVHEILSRRKDFIKPIAVFYEWMGAFGPSIGTTEGDTWQRHRKATAPCFNEQAMALVWGEALCQAQGLLEIWVRKGSRGTDNTVEDSATLTLHVLCSAIFGTRYSSFSDEIHNSTPGYEFSYRSALHLILKNLIVLFVTPRRLLFSPFAPKSLRRLGRATIEFKRYMEEMLTKERRLISNGITGSRNLTSVLIRASEAVKSNGGISGLKPNQALSDDEIFGNIFMFNIAGHETTANSFSYSIALLAAYPEWQDWLAEEIAHVFSSNDMKSWDYHAGFPKLKRCLAVMYETLRLYGSVVFIPKQTGSHPQSLTLNNRTCTIPPQTSIYLNLQALHTNPTEWGSDALTWNPARWFTNRQKDLETESMIERPESFIPWAEGAHDCPGRKFSQVEFVAAIAVFFRRHRVRPAMAARESFERAQARVLAMVNDSALPEITLQMQHPKSVSLVWTPQED